MSVKQLSALWRSINWFWLIVTMLVFAVLIKLGLWQTSRAEQKEQRLQQIEQLLGKEYQPLDKVLNSLTGERQLNDQPVIIEGKFDPEILLLKDNQTFEGRLGYRVYQLFYHQQQLPVLINLGWVAGSRNRQKLPDVKPITGHYQLKGHIRFIEPGVMLAEQNYQHVTMPLRVQQIEIDKLSELFAKQLLPFAVYLDKNETTGYKKNWQPVVMSPEKHRGYAFQWFSLAIAWLVLMLVAAIKNNNNKAKV